MPTFSVIIPCWNAARTLGATLASVQAQTFGDFEVIIVDDGSQDDTVEIARPIVESDARFRLVRQANGGPSRARNAAAFEHATGTYIAFLDADDLWVPYKLARCAQVLTQPGDRRDVLYGRIGFFRETPDDVETFSRVVPDVLTALDLIGENAVCTMSNVVVSRECFLRSGGFDPAVVHGEDVEWLIRLAIHGARIEAIDELLVFYRASDAGLSADFPAMRQGWQVALDAARRAGLEPNPTEVAAAEAIHLRYLARRALRVASRRGTALKLAVEAIGRSPSGYFSDTRRGLLILAGAVCDAVLPAALFPTRRR